MDTMQEIARILRSTDKMAANFVKSVQERTGPNASEEIILAALQQLNPRSIEIRKVITAVKKELAKKPRRTRKRTTKTVTIQAGASQKTVPSTARKGRRSSASQRQTASSKRTAPRTLLVRLEEVLEANWKRAEQEGFQPERFSGSDFVKAVHRHCDPRDATRSRILRACKMIDKQDIIITSTAVADLIREES
jgi:hypothetical protein